MLFLLFHLDDARYALPASRLAVVLPRVQTRALPATPPWVSGVFMHDGQAVPVIDFCRLVLDRPARARLSTRTALVHYPLGNGNSRLLGLVLEQATDTLRCDPAAFVATGVDTGDTRYPGPVCHDRHGLIQRVDIDELLPPPVRALLFPTARAGA
ncbi:chemotaxis protein CheW [Microvirgula curvata]